MKKVIKQYQDYKIVMDADDFNVIRRGELMLTTMSLNKADAYFSDMLYYDDLLNKKKQKA